ncbi:MAG: STM4014 family protein [Cyanobacteria bacterium]|nr:STM4014 family protein [Cyanobacteriota bacterium]
MTQNQGCAKKFLVIGNPESRRVELFQNALDRLGIPAAEVISYMDLLKGKRSLFDSITEETIVRIESPGKDYEVELELLRLGEEGAREEGSASISNRDLTFMTFDRGRIICPRQWYHGFCRFLQSASNDLNKTSPYLVMNHPIDISVMFDKTLCNERLANAKIPVPPYFGEVTCFEELEELMRSRRCTQVFVKIRNGSSASGVVAYRSNGIECKAITTVEIARDNSKLVLYNSRKLCTYDDRRQIKELIDELCRHRAHVERWIPKATIDRTFFDLRVVVIAGQPEHTVVRLSKNTLTNLHLLNKRDRPDSVRKQFGEERWESAMSSCQRAMQCFPASYYAGIDLLISSGFSSHAVLEVNAFGDQIEGVLIDGEDTYTREIRSILVSSDQNYSQPAKLRS